MPVCFSYDEEPTVNSQNDLTVGTSSTAEVCDTCHSHFCVRLVFLPTAPPPSAHFPLLIAPCSGLS